MRTNICNKIVFLLVFLTAGTNILSACSCYYIPYFCDAISSQNIIVRAEVTDSIDFERRNIRILDYIRNGYSNSEYVIEGQDGVNCGEWMDNFAIGDTVVFALTWDEYSFPIDTLFLNGYCGLHYLRYQENKVIGNIRPGVLEMDYQEFVDGILACLQYTATNYINTAEIELFPNPVYDNFSINSRNQKLNQVEIFSLAGQKVLDLEISPTNYINLDLLDLPQGTYVVKVEMENTMALRKMVKL